MSTVCSLGKNSCPLCPWPLPHEEAVVTVAAMTGDVPQRASGRACVAMAMLTQRQR